MTAPRFDFGPGHALAMAGVKDEGPAVVIDLMAVLKASLAKRLDPEPLAQPPARSPAPSKPCDHGKVPWWDCEECSATSNYSFGGNFR